MVFAHSVHDKIVGTEILRFLRYSLDTINEFNWSGVAILCKELNGFFSFGNIRELGCDIRIDEKRVLNLINRLFH